MISGNHLLFGEVFGPAYCYIVSVFDVCGHELDLIQLKSKISICAIFIGISVEKKLGTG